MPTAHSATPHYSSNASTAIIYSISTGTQQKASQFASKPPIAASCTDHLIKSACTNHRPTLLLLNKWKNWHKQLHKVAITFFSCRPGMQQWKFKRRVKPMIDFITRHWISSDQFITLRTTEGAVHCFKHTSVSLHVRHLQYSVKSLCDTYQYFKITKITCTTSNPVLRDPACIRDSACIQEPVSIQEFTV